MKMIRSFFAAACLLAAMCCQNSAKATDPVTTSAARPNIIYLMLDEWGYFEMSGLGHDKISTPTFDRVMAQGMRFTQCLAGGPVCGPTRASLMTGKHLGHTSMRSNGGGTPIRADDVTIAQLLKKAGYATGGFGKWGIGGRGTSGVPEKTYAPHLLARLCIALFLIDCQIQIPRFF